MKKLFTLLTIFTIFTVISCNSVFASNAEANPSVSVDNTSETSASTAIASFRKATSEAIRIAKLKTSGDSYITARINALNKLITRINNANIDTSSKTILLAKVESMIAQLNTLKTNIDGETSLTVIKSDIRSIFNGHYTYSLFIPSLYGEVTASRINKEIGTLTALEPQIESYLSQLNTNGVDISSGNTAYTDFKTQLEAAATAVQNAITKFGSIDLNNFATSKQILASGRAYLTTARQDLGKAKNDLQIIYDLGQ